MQQVPASQFIFRPGYFKYIKENKGTKRKRKLQWEPAPMRKIGFKTDVPTQFPKQPQRHRSQGQTQKTVCSLVDPFGEPQLQRKSEPNKYGSQEGQVI